MKTFAWIAGLCLVAGVVQAQEDTRVVSPAKVSHDSAWYAREAGKWQRIARQDKRNELAWENYYRATRYQLTWNTSPDGAQKAQPVLDGILKEMEKAIPGSFTYNFLMYYNGGGRLDKGPYMERAIALRPDDASRYSDYVPYLLRARKDSLLTDVCRKWYAGGEYSPSLLNYGYNQLAGMEPDALFFTNGDIPVFTDLLLHRGMGLFPGIRTICLGWITVPDYYEPLLEELGIPPFHYDPKDVGRLYKDWQGLSDAIVRHILKHTSRPAYFSVVLSKQEVAAFRDKLYSEGLVMRYAEKPYDNMAVLRRNFEQRYLTDYLRERFHPESNYPDAARFDLNYLPCFSPLLQFYRQSGDLNQARRLESLFRAILERADLPGAQRQDYEHLFEADGTTGGVER